ncbi:hypothetical protein C8R44DRAFT_551261, partial [Mycena epipterygia]
MIFAGDFAQLPPVKASTLFGADNGENGQNTARGAINRQKNIIGKMIWQQVTTVVILKTNMRQTTDSEGDTKLRTALANMRYGACTQEDLAYLETRTVSRRPGHPNYTDVRLRNVSIITGLNAQKDKINAMGCEKYAEETNQELVHFYSDDVLCNTADVRKPKGVRKKKTLKKTKGIDKADQQQLWDAWPSSTSLHIPGKLSLCLGMPVMIRNNDATELCITKGQESIVVGWQEATGNSGQKILDTLFVQLVKPPEDVNIVGLPTNVVALTRGSKKVYCSMKNDSMLHITRDQVAVLPNFAMTDYASQGKSRDFNVVDLNNCRTHYSYYTALSRSTCSDGTVLLQGISPAKITSGISGHLRQEFRELELLNEITALRFLNSLPDSIRGINRREILRSYHVWQDHGARWSARFSSMGKHTGVLAKGFESVWIGTSKL